MTPVRFPQANRTLIAPAGMEADCDPLRVHVTPEHVISCWRPSAEERQKIADGGDIWIWNWSPQGTQAPMSVSADSPFELSA